MNRSPFIGIQSIMLSYALPNILAGSSRLKGLRAGGSKIIEEADRKHPSYTRFLRDVVAREYNLKRERSRLLRLKKARQCW